MLRYWSSEGCYKWLNEDQQFYLYHHIAVLGFSVVHRVARRLGMTSDEAIQVFNELHKRKKPNQLAG
ncbi:hypothetical protein CAY60_017920 [Shouchella clausii]|jgi:hypothetical protein|uniref:hypothetical protein n=1 Tax=Shouchella TaxID=2893057 RepID=UPI00054DC859|nr:MULTISPECIES: hypothetical protein [Shouchella]MCM3312008.1 hypothetical protein [Psychrobacillus sp. MER TA 17]MBU3231005.1 hypothetical protein [Shouchella clausii]MBU3262920.1 hypothetical protein [Shouchella clausii]MBU3505385.1 hypothetical protein [Shouchella clausii]MBU3534402.1 hypothetical protein [Shouchella clausii]